MASSADCYRRFLEGDKKAFDALMEAFFYPLVFFVDRYVQDIHTAEEVAMDVFSDLIVHPKRYDFKMSFKTYLFMAARRRALHCLQRPKEVKAPTEVPEGLHTLEELVLTTHLQYRVHEALARFPEQQRTAVHLVYFERFTYDDVAVVLKTKRKQVDEFLKVAKRELCVILGKDGERIL